MSYTVPDPLGEAALESAVASLTQSAVPDGNIIYNGTIIGTGVAGYQPITIPANRSRKTFYIQNTGTVNIQIVRIDAYNNKLTLTVPAGNNLSFESIKIADISPISQAGESNLEQSVIRCEWQGAIILNNVDPATSATFEALEVT